MHLLVSIARNQAPSCVRERTDVASVMVIVEVLAFD